MLVAALTAVRCVCHKNIFTATRNIFAYLHFVGRKTLAEAIENFLLYLSKHSIKFHYTKNDEETRKIGSRTDIGAKLFFSLIFEGWNFLCKKKKYLLFFPNRNYYTKSEMNWNGIMWLSIALIRSAKNFSELIIRNSSK